MTDEPSSPHHQVGALPWRLTNGAPELLLVTSRGTRQWIIPKGWPMAGLSDPDAAAREAFEEAGVQGEIGEDAVGCFAYEKARKGEETVSPFSCTVYLLRVERQLTFWPEAGQRSLAWVSPEQAQTLVTNESLRALLATVEFPQE